MHPVSIVGVQNTVSVSRRDPTAGDLMNPLRASGTTRPALLSSAMEGRLKAKGFVAVEGMGAGSIAALITAMAFVNSSMWQSDKMVRATVESMSTVARDGAKEHPGLRIIMKVDDLPKGVSGMAACGHRVVRKLKSCSSVAKVAGSISKITRSAPGGSLPVGLVLTDESAVTINTAVKSIALTRTMLKHDGLDVSFTAYPVGCGVQMTVLPLPDCSLITADEFLFLPLERYEHGSNASSFSSPDDDESVAEPQSPPSRVSSLRKANSFYTHDPYSWGTSVEETTPKK